MKMFYSATTNGFYAVEIHGDKMPPDAIEISNETYEQCKGRDLIAGNDGLPMIREPEPLTLDQRAAQLLSVVDDHLNAAAKAKGYDSIITASLRAALPASPFHDEGVAFGTWMDQVYAKCYEVLAQVKGGAITEPTESELIDMLPVLVLPS